MIFCNLRNTEPVLAQRNGHVFTKRRLLSSCHGERVYSNRDLYGLNSETLILFLQKLPFPIFEIENFVLEFWPAFRDLVPLCFMDLNCPSAHYIKFLTLPARKTFLKLKFFFSSRKVKMFIFENIFYLISWLLYALLLFCSYLLVI